jgi:uncharacterized protein with HEPN domain
MRPREIRVYLLDSIEAAERIVAIRQEVGPQRLREDEIVRAAIERHLITVGEALNKADGIDATLRDRISHLPAIIGLRNRLVHGYFAIEWSRIVELVESDVDVLLGELRRQAS